jgi:hypothetical protein
MSLHESEIRSQFLAKIRAHYAKKCGAAAVSKVK